MTSPLSKSSNVKSIVSELETYLRMVPCFCAIATCFAIICFSFVNFAIVTAIISKAGFILSQATIQRVQVALV